MTTAIAQAHLSQLVLIDVQERLANVMQPDAMAAITKACSLLVQAAQLLQVDVLVSEQYPKGLGHTLPDLLAHLPDVKAVEKTVFSCMAEPKFSRQLTADKPQIILAGMEAHICVLQTALAMQAAGKQVFVVEDAILSRSPANKINALARMREAGCVITNAESVVFEWLGKAEGDIFKSIAKIVR